MTILTILTFFYNFDNWLHFSQFRQLLFHFDNWIDNPGDLWHLRHWLQFWQLRTQIHDNLCYLTINCDTGQHSQFLRCLWIQCELPVRNHDTSSPKNIHELTFSDMWRLLRRQMFHTCWGEFIYLFKKKCLNTFVDAHFCQIMKMKDLTTESILKQVKTYQDMFWGFTEK